MKPDISSGNQPSWWLLNTPQIQGFSGKLSRNMETDVCVVGGGIGGLTSAYFLLKQGKRVVLLEDGEILSGETGRTTAHLMSAVDDRFQEVEKHFGKEGSSTMYRASAMAIDLIEQIIKENNIDCDFHRVDGYLFEDGMTRSSFLDKELESAHNAGFSSAVMVDHAPVNSEEMKKKRAIKFSNQGQFHVSKYLNAVASKIVDMGGFICTHTHAMQFYDGDENTPARVLTSTGLTVTALDGIVCATSIPVCDRVTMITKLEMMRTYAIAFKIPKGSLLRALYWSTEEPYHYVRINEDKDYDVLITGGEDHKVGVTTQSYDKIMAQLEAWTRKRFPMCQEVLSGWSGEVVEPVDLVHYLGKNPGNKKIYIITGDSGTGMTSCTLGARLITDLICFGQAKYVTPDMVSLFDPSRLATRAKIEFIKSNIENNVQFVDYISSGDIGDIEDLKPGCGAIIRQGLMKYAVYRDEVTNQVYQCSAVCPHLKGLVRYNPLEKSFDCPVHGSRFSVHGIVMDGPANENLEPMNDFTKQRQVQEFELIGKEPLYKHQQQQQQQEEISQASKI